MMNVMFLIPSGVLMKHLNDFILETLLEVQKTEYDGSKVPETALIFVWILYGI